MKFQPGPGYCAPAAIQNAARALGVRISVDRIAKYAGTTASDGTTQHGIKQALERLKFRHVDISTPDLEVGRDALFRHVQEAGNPAIILTEYGEHWETIIGCLGSRYVIFDPQNLKRNKDENGVHIVGPEELASYWTPFEGAYYAILVSREETAHRPTRKTKSAVRDTELPLQKESQ